MLRRFSSMSCCQLYWHDVIVVVCCCLLFAVCCCLLFVVVVVCCLLLFVVCCPCYCGDWRQCCQASLSTLIHHQQLLIRDSSVWKQYSSACKRSRLYVSSQRWSCSNSLLSQLSTTAFLPTLSARWLRNKTLNTMTMYIMYNVFKVNQPCVWTANVHSQLMIDHPAATPTQRFQQQQQHQHNVSNSNSNANTTFPTATSQ